jgi:hypothetical protein
VTGEPRWRSGFLRFGGKGAASDRNDDGVVGHEEDVAGLQRMLKKSPQGKKTYLGG